MKGIATGPQTHANGTQAFRKLRWSTVGPLGITIHPYCHPAVEQHLIIEHRNRLE